MMEEDVDSMMALLEKKVDEPEARVDDTSKIIVDIPLVFTVGMPPVIVPTDDL